MYNNIDFLRELLLDTFEAFRANGECEHPTATQQLRAKFEIFKSAAVNAQDIRAMTEVIMAARGSVRANEFFLPQKLVAYHEILVALDWLAHNKMLSHIGWREVLNNMRSSGIKRRLFIQRPSA